MGDVIEFPANIVPRDATPKLGDRYEAFGLADKIEPRSLAFIFPDWSRVYLPYDRMRMGGFRPLDDDRNEAGECMMTLIFEAGRLPPGFRRLDLPPGEDILVVITGRTLFGLFDHVGQRQVHWIWQAPAEPAAVAASAPLVRRIEIKEASPAIVAALMP